MGTYYTKTVTNSYEIPSLHPSSMEFCYNSKDKRGHKRKELHVQTCFPYLMKWIIKWWDSDQLAIALDATTLELKFTILAVSVVYRGCAIPVAWTITKGNEKGETKNLPLKTS